LAFIVFQWIYEPQAASRAVRPSTGASFSIVFMAVILVLLRETA
jgi:hypothetical protein